MAIVVAGITLTSAPVSTKKQPPEILSPMKSRPGMWLDAMAPTDAQTACFPAIHMAAGFSEPLRQTYGDNSKGWMLYGAVFYLALVVSVDATEQHQ